MKFVIGYASLLSEISIRRLFPNVGHILPVEIPNHARCFNSYGTLSITAKLAKTGSRELAHASAILRPHSTLLALAFELDETDFETYEKHEFRYSLREVKAVVIDTRDVIPATICYENTDPLIRTELVGAQNIFELYEQYGVRSFWHGKYLPAEIYLQHCLAGARDLGSDFLDNFLDVSLTYDRETSLRQYLEGRTDNLENYIQNARLSSVF